MINLTIDGRSVEVEKGTSIFQAAAMLGIEIPAMCSHKALEPYGACRLCIVELKGYGRNSVEASCTYPCEEGLVVETATPRIRNLRKVLAELMLARCPGSGAVAEIAERLGVKATRIDKIGKDCILCGLCVRMCAQRMGPASIGFVNRGYKREVGPPFGHQSEACQTCGACVTICPTGKLKMADVSTRTPVPIEAEFDEKLRLRPPIYILYPQAVPRKAVIDPRYCVHLLENRCGVCAEVCQAKAINYEQKEEFVDLEVGTIILSPGHDRFEAGLKGEYGYGRYKNVVTSLELERILSASGPFKGHLQRLSDGAEPRKMAFIQCVGSRDPSHAREYCSSVCCTYAVKEAIIAREHSKGELETKIFYMDMRTFGKGFDAYYEKAKKEYSVKFERARAAEVSEIPGTGTLSIKYENEEGRLVAEEFDMVVLSVGLCSPHAMKETAERLGISVDENGFCKTEELSPLETSRPGIYVAGSWQGPKDIPETVMQASGAASLAGKLIAEKRGTQVTIKEFPPEIDVTGQEPRVGVFVCHCGTNIAGILSVPGVVEHTRSLPDVVFATNLLYACSEDSQSFIKESIREHRLNRVVVASCTPRTHESLFRSSIREAGLNPYLFEMANIRDQCSWVHMKEPQSATRKAKDLVRMAVAKARLLEALHGKKLKVNKNAMVIGAGLSGMTAALDLAEQGFEAYLLEREKEPGGNLKSIRFTLGGEDPQRLLLNIIEKVRSNPKIHLYTESKIEKVEGTFGNFKATVAGGGKVFELDAGVIIVATGAREHKPDEYLYGQDERIMTHRELEGKIANGGLQDPKNIVMIQCVGSRENGRPYCSRVCCAEGIKLALKLKEKNRDTQVYILYRDIRTYGLTEKYYTRAREKGIIFVRYDEKELPSVSKEGERLLVKVRDPLIDADLIISPEIISLAPAIVPNEDNKELSQLLKVSLDQNNFFLEAHMKLRPVDFATEGIFCCGICHSPKTAGESISQAHGAAARATTLISKDDVELNAAQSFIVDENCDGCAYCVDPCPFKAITLFEYAWEGGVKKSVEVNESICKGCGICMATCPKQGCYVRNFRLQQLSAMVEAALEL